MLETEPFPRETGLMSDNLGNALKPQAQFP